MTGRDVFSAAVRLLNYTNTYGELDGNQGTEMWKRSLAIVNQIYADVSFIENHTAAFVPLKNIHETLHVSDRTASDVMPYGVAMLFAQNENDGDNQTLFAMLYNQKRSAVPRAPMRIQDVLPVTEG